jgi:hypothetical protein
MIDHASQARIEELFRRENRSFLQYIAQATPWASPADRPLVDKIGQLAAEELLMLERLAEWMEAQRIPLPYLGAFPTSFMNYNFIDIRKLLKPLATEQGKELADLEADAKALNGNEVRPQIESLVDLNRAHLMAMEEMAKPAAA